MSVSLGEGVWTIFALPKQLFFVGRVPFIKLFKNYINYITTIIIITVRNVTWPGSFVNELLVDWRLIAKLSELARINGRQVCGSDWD